MGRSSGQSSRFMASTVETKFDMDRPVPSRTQNMACSIRITFVGNGEKPQLDVKYGSHMYTYRSGNMYGQRTEVSALDKNWHASVVIDRFCYFSDIVPYQATWLLQDEYDRLEDLARQSVRCAAGSRLYVIPTRLRLVHKPPSMVYMMHDFDECAYGSYTFTALRRFETFDEVVIAVPNDALRQQLKSEKDAGIHDGHYDRSPIYIVGESGIGKSLYASSLA